MATGRVPTTANSPLTAKGDLFTYSTTQARLAVGNNGDTLLADSSTSTGLRYNPQNALVNPVINGGMDIWQRGTSIAGTTTSFSADRWQSYRGVAGSTFSRQTVSDSTNLPNIQYACDSGNTSTTSIFLWQNFETVNSIPFAGKTITFSFYARCGANYSNTASALNANLYTGTGTDQNGLTSTLTGLVIAISQNATLTTTWQRFTYTATVGSTATQLALGFSFSPIGTAGANDWYEVTGVQIDVGTYTASTAPTFRRSGGTLQGELAACQRYYWQIGTGSSAAYEPAGLIGVFPDTGSFLGPVQAPVAMRSTPTITTTGSWEAKNNGIVLTGASISTTTFYTHFLLNWNCSGATAWRSDNIRNSNSAGALMRFSSEL